MKNNLIKIAVDSLFPDSSQPRKYFSEAELQALAHSLRINDQKIPIIVWCNNGRYIIIDGERRWKAAPAAGLSELWAVVLPAEPTAAELAVARMNIDVHRASLTTNERSDALARIQTENNWSVTALAERLAMSQPVVSKLLVLQKLHAEVRAMLDRGELDAEKAVMIAQEPDPEKQLALAKEAIKLSRDQLRARLKGDKPNAARATSARFVMPGGVSVLVKAQSLTLSTCIEVLIETVKQLKKGQSSGHDINTLPRVMENQCKQPPKSSLN